VLKAVSGEGAAAPAPVGDPGAGGAGVEEGAETGAGVMESGFSAITLEAGEAGFEGVGVSEIKSQGSKTATRPPITRKPQSQGFFQREGLGAAAVGSGPRMADFARDQWHSWQNSCRVLTRAPQWGQKARSYSGNLRLAPQDRQKRAFPSAGSWQ